MRVISATLLRPASGQSARDRHAAALASLLNGHARGAASRLDALARENPADASVWSDLAATKCEVAIRENDPSMLVEALAAADAALRLQPGLSEALFNRAMVLEHLGVRQLARAAWDAVVTADDGSGWRDEAQRRISGLPPLQPFHELLEQNYERLAADPAAARELARARPLECRVYGESLILGRWAEAMAAGDGRMADRHLRIARAFGAELARNRQDGMLDAAVRAIDQANEAQRQHLGRGHILLREGQAAFGADRNAAANAIFSNAARELELGGSPIARLAKYYLAHTYHALGNLPEARRREQLLLRECPADYPAHRAQLLWHLGLGYQSDGQWGKALDAFNESVSIFERLGEIDYATIVRELIAEVYDRTGDPDQAWQQRIIALRGIGRTTTLRLLQLLDSAARGAILRKQWLVAVSLLDLAGETAKKIDDPGIEVDMRLLQARASWETADAIAAARAIRLARAAASRIDDVASRNEAEADLMATEAIISPPSQRTVDLLTQAIDFHRTRGRRILVPEMLLHRARALRSLRRNDLAAADAEAGIAEIETHRESLPAGESRWGIFHSAEELFEQAVGIALDAGEDAKAFAYSERARARQLLESLGSSAPAFDAATLDPNVVLLEYFPLPDRLVIFAAGSKGISVAQADIDRASLEREAEQFGRAIQVNAPDWRGISRRLHRTLLDPIEREIPGGATLVIVPSHSLSIVPFAALLDDTGRFLIEKQTVVIAPSAAVFAHLTERSKADRRLERLLVVANPATDDVPRTLGSAEREATDVAAMYARPVQLTDATATLGAFRRAAPDADVIHFATHGAPGVRGSGALFLADGRLDSRAIAAIRMPRTSAVVLAACDTARGPTRAEGTISVARAFLAAGVPQVAATLWEIDDQASAEFFPRLHRHLVRGGTLPDALREAQLESIRTGKSPALWAAVQCMGSK